MKPKIYLPKRMESLCRLIKQKKVMFQEDEDLHTILNISKRRVTISNTSVLSEFIQNPSSYKRKWQHAHISNAKRAYRILHDENKRIIYDENNDILEAENHYPDANNDISETMSHETDAERENLDDNIFLDDIRLSEIGIGLFDCLYMKCPRINFQCIVCKHSSTKLQDLQRLRFMGENTNCVMGSFN